MDVQQRRGCYGLHGGERIPSGRTLSRPSATHVHLQIALVTLVRTPDVATLGSSPPPGEGAWLAFGLTFTRRWAPGRDLAVHAAS